MSEKNIQFIANYDDWVCIKKLKIEEKTDPRTIMEFLAGLGTGIDRKIEANLRKIVDLEKLDAALAEETSGKDIAAALAAANSRKVSAIINEITTLPELQKNEQKELQGFCKVYALKKTLKEAGLKIDYSEIEIPGIKRIKKVKV